MAARFAWPCKTRDIRNHHFDSTVWDEFAFRDGDIVIASYAKSGTTWTQQIVGQLVFGGDPAIRVADLSPWLDLRVPEKSAKLGLLAAQTHRRFVKTHLPVDALPLSPRAKYLYIARDGRDVAWSLHNHHSRANALWYQLLNDTPGRYGPPIGLPRPDPRAYFLDWLDGDGHPFWPYWESVRSWWAIRDLPNVLLLHYADLKADLPGEVDRIARFLDIRVDARVMQRVLEHSSFAWMKTHADRAAPLGGICWDGGAGDFIHKGTNGRWRDALTAEDCARYERRALTELGRSCARWLAKGARGLNAPAARSSQHEGPPAMAGHDGIETPGDALPRLAGPTPKPRFAASPATAAPLRETAAASMGLEIRPMPGRVTEECPPASGLRLRMSQINGAWP